MPAWYIDRFNSEVSDGVLADLAFAMQRGYMEAAEACKDRFPHFGSEKAVGVNRWFFIEEALLGLRAQHDALRAVQLPNYTRSHHFALLRTYTTYFTVAKVARPDAAPPKALFRTALQSPLQLSWLDGWQGLPVDGLCALLIHGPYRDDPSTPAFLQIKFMDGEEGYLPEHIDLHKEYLSPTATVPRVDIPERLLVRTRPTTVKRAT